MMIKHSGVDLQVDFITSKTAIRYVYSYLLFGFFASLLAGCAPIQVKTDYNKDINFDQYKSYAWIPNDQPDIVDVNFDKAILDDIVTKTANKKLGDEGYNVNESSPDFLITYFLAIDTKTDVFIVENNYSNIPYALPPTSSSTRDYQRLRENTYEQGILIIDIVDAKSKEKIWRGYAQSRLGIYKEPAKQKQRVATSIKKILSKFPP